MCRLLILKIVEFQTGATTTSHLSGDQQFKPNLSPLKTAAGWLLFTIQQSVNCSVIADNLSLFQHLPPASPPDNLQNPFCNIESLHGGSCQPWLSPRGPGALCCLSPRVVSVGYHCNLTVISCKAAASRKIQTLPQDSVAWILHHKM